MENDSPSPLMMGRWGIERPEGDRIQEQKVRLDRKRHQRTTHRQQRGLKDVQAIDLRLRRSADADTGGAANNFSKEPNTVRFDDLLGVVEPRQATSSR